MSQHPFSVRQKIFKANHSDVLVTQCAVSNIKKDQLDHFLCSVQGDFIGAAPTYGTKARLVLLALSSETEVLLITMSGKSARSASSTKKAAVQPGLRLLQDMVLCHPDKSIVAFQMDILSSALYFDFGIHINSALDLLSVSKADRTSLEARMNALGGEVTLNKGAVKDLFRNDEVAKNPPEVTALQAWAATISASLPSMLPGVRKIQPIDTSVINQESLMIIGKTIRDGSRLLALKPTRVKNEVDKEVKRKGTLEFTSTRYKSRLMQTQGQQSLEIKMTSGAGPSSFLTARVTQTNGRAATVVTNRSIGNGEIHSIYTIGREPPTNAESRRSATMLNALQGKISLLEDPFIQTIWSHRPKAPLTNAPPSTSPILQFTKKPLNVSQTRAVNAILSNANEDRVVLIHGPPGTGKTTVIAASVTSAMSAPDPSLTMWLVAQSNVAVKNIAEKLASIDFFDFKILVSKDFHFDWHEHLYEKINKNLLRSDDFVNDRVVTERQLLGSRVILCTLSMLSNPKVVIFSILVPLQTVIFDEASQIEIGDYFPMLSCFQRTLRKLVFIGDDRQLAPYGESDISDLESIFEKSHLRNRAVFLDTQYRMPLPIGTFISQNVYKGRLRSEHNISTPKSCRFLNVQNGHEQSQGHSWKNVREADVILKLASQFVALGRSFRIITPYDSQRAFLENGLKAAGLPWKDKCFNIDSFQGNEDDYILISLVRTEKMGFMKEIRRVNVMLTRCKRGMVVCTNRKFIEGPGKKSLVGKLAESLGETTWVEARQILYGDFKIL